MSLTVASGALDTGWAEFNTVAFTASTLGTLSDCIDEVGSKLNRGTISSTSNPKDSDIARWLIRGKQELAEIKKFTFRRRYVTANTVASQYRYGLPPDYGGGRINVRDVTNDRQIVLWDANIFDTMFPDPSEENADEPLVGCIKDRELWLCPPPAGIYALEADYDRTGDDITTSDFSWLPEIERFRVCDFATAESFYALKEFDAGDRYYNRWEKGLFKAVRADSKRKWHSRNFQAISVLQAFRAYNNQPDST